MPVHPPSGLRQLGEHQFRQLAYEVMHIIFQVHNEMGCLFDEVIYQNAIAARFPGVRIEVPLEIFFDTFRKTYYLDLLLRDGGGFELKAAETVHNRHRAQLLNYLLIL